MKSQRKRFLKLGNEMGTDAHHWITPWDKILKSRLDNVQLEQHRVSRAEHGCLRETPNQLCAGSWETGEQEADYEWSTVPADREGSKNLKCYIVNKE
jgi:hypothetical protein